MGEKAVDRNHRNGRISPEFVLSQYSVILKTLKDEEVPEARVTLRGLIRQLIYVMPPKQRFFHDYIHRCVSKSLRDDQEVEKLKEVFGHMQVYCENLIKMFWKKEVKVIKRHTGLYKNILEVLPDVDLYMENMGYVHDRLTDSFTLKNCQLLDMEKIMKLGFDWFLTQALIQFIEDVYSDLKRKGYSWKQVKLNGMKFVGTEDECVSWFMESVVPESKMLRNSSEPKVTRLVSREANGMRNDDDLYSDSKRVRATPLPREGSDLSFNSVEKWLNDNHSDDHSDHLRRIERYKQIERQQEMARQEDDMRRQYNDMKKHHQQNEVSRPYGDELKFDPIDSNGQNVRIGKTSPNVRKKVTEELPMAVPKSQVDRKKGTRSQMAPSYSAAVSNGRTGSSRSSAASSDSRKQTDTKDREEYLKFFEPKRQTADNKKNEDYLKFLEGDKFTLDDEEEDMYSDVPVRRKLPLKPDSFVMVDGKELRGGVQRRPARPLSEINTRQYAFDSGLRDIDFSGQEAVHVGAGKYERKKASVPDVYSVQGTQEDHMKNSLTALGLESEASSMSMDHGFDDWVKDYKEREEARKGNKQSDLDWARYHNLETAAQDYLGNKTDTFNPGESLFDFDIPTMDIHRPPGLSDLCDVQTGVGLTTQLDNNVEQDGLARHSKTGFPSMGLSGRSVALEKPVEAKRSASSRNSVHLPIRDTPEPRAGKFPSTLTIDSNRRHTLASQAASADLTRPEYAQILKDSLKGVKNHSDLGQNRTVSYPTTSRTSVSKSLGADVTKRDSARSQSVKNPSIHYNTLPATPSSSSVWKCKSCDHINGKNSEICLYCKRGREFAGKKWQCVDCTYLNSPETDVCTICDKSRTKGSEKSPLEVGGRECSKCTYINPTGATKCEICDDPLIVYAVHI